MQIQILKILKSGISLKHLGSIVRVLAGLGVALFAQGAANTVQAAQPQYLRAGARGEPVSVTLSANQPAPIVYMLTSGASSSNVRLRIEGPEGLKARVLTGEVVGSVTLAQSKFSEAGLFSVSSVVRSGVEVSDATALLPKDSCNPGRRYAVEIILDASSVAPEALEAGAILQVAFLETILSGSRAASIKPVSDGKFYPQPLLLMSSIAARVGGNEDIYTYSWQRGGPAAIRRVGISDYVSYRNLFLTRTPIGSLLKSPGVGRSQTFLLLNKDFSYSVCFSLERRSQSVNGYPR